MTKKPNHQVSKISGANRTQLYVALLRVTEQMFPDNVTASVVTALVVAALNLLDVVLSRRQAVDAARRGAAPLRAPRPQ